MLIHVSNFRQVKRIDTIIETFAKVREKIPSKLILLGDGPELVPMRQKTKRVKRRRGCFIFRETRLRK